MENEIIMKVNLMEINNPLPLPFPILSPAPQKEPFFSSFHYFLALTCMCQNNVSFALFIHSLMHSRNKC